MDYAMKVNFHRNAAKSLEKYKANDIEKIRNKIKELIKYYDNRGIIPYNELKVKNLDGKWKGLIPMTLL